MRMIVFFFFNLSEPEKAVTFFLRILLCLIKISIEISVVIRIRFDFVCQDLYQWADRPQKILKLN
jgi:hypothetical protein